MLSIPHMIVVFVIVLVVFGPQKLPELARGLGKLMAEFRKASTDFRSAFEEEMRDLERQAREVERKKPALLASAANGAQPETATPASPAPAETPSTASDSATPAEQARATEAGTLTAEPVAESVARATEPGSNGDQPEPQIPETQTQDARPAGSFDPTHDQQQPA